MRSGRLRNPSVVFQTDEGTADASGQVIERWVRKVKRRAAIRPIGGRELVSANQTLGEVSHIVEVRYDQTTKTITNEDRVLFDSRIFNIVHVQNMGERNRWLRMQAVEQTGVTYTAATPVLNAIAVTAATPPLDEYEVSYDWDVIDGPTATAGWAINFPGPVSAIIDSVVIEDGVVKVYADPNGGVGAFEIVYDGTSGPFTVENEYVLNTIEEE
ncbi:MAG: hypothetical protein DHS20C16_03520 [Phycisphaerae bacterium]|nr:MAG: hypothetical protein DHS20C16_03520 [Phycisphaerae bacterium]